MVLETRFKLESATQQTPHPLNPPQGDIATCHRSGYGKEH